MTVYEQLAAAEALLKDLLAEQDKEVLRARLCEGHFTEGDDERSFPSDYPFEQFTIGMAHNVAILAEQFYKHVRERFPLPPGSKVVTSSRIISTWRGPLEPVDPTHPLTPPDTSK